MELKQLATICLLGVSVLANAERAYMTVELNSGSKYNFLLADKPVLTYKNMELVVNGEAGDRYRAKARADGIVVTAAGTLVIMK